MKVWIDLDNTPHVPFFRPIYRELIERGHQVYISARADGQTVELARLFALPVDVVGGWRGTGTAAKVGATLWRAAQLAGYAAVRRPDVLVSHGSRPALLAAAPLRIPAVTLYDYEGSSTSLFHRLSTRVLVPQVVLDANNDALPTNVAGYPGFKEDVYLADFSPSTDARVQLGIAPDDVVVVLRPESETAHYRADTRASLLDAVLDHLAREPRVRVLLLPRTHDQGTRIASALHKRNVRVDTPAAADGRDLVSAADLVIGGGGTMTREAAVLGVPAYSIFRGRDGAVDGALEREGMLIRIRDGFEIARIHLVPRTDAALHTSRGVRLLHLITDEICSLDPQAVE